MLKSISLNKHKYSNILKYGVGLFAFVYIYIRIDESITSDFFQTFSFINLTYTQYIYLILSVVFMFGNWGIEAYKWKLLMEPIEKISYIDSIKATLSGISVGMFTPNRIGEFGGRVLYISKTNRFKAGVFTVMGSFSQLIVTMILGGLSFIYVLYDRTQLSDIITIALFSISILASLALLSIYYNYTFLWHYVKKTFIYHLIKKTNIKLTVLSKVILNKSLFLSLLRYSVFNIQYVLLLYGLGFELNIIICLIATSTVFFIQTAVPTVALFELGIRSAGAIGIFSLFEANEAMVIIASILLWLINLIIPALLGLFFLMFSKYDRIQL